MRGAVARDRDEHAHKNIFYSGDRYERVYGCSSAGAGAGTEPRMRMESFGCLSAAFCAAATMAGSDHVPILLMRFFV